MKPLHPLGAHHDRGRTSFRLYCSGIDEVAARIVDDDGSAIAEYPMVPDGDGHYSVTVEGRGPGTQYHFVLDGRPVPDPYARFLPHGVHGAAMVVDSHFAWKHAAPLRPPGSHVVYELHPGTFTPEGTYQAARGKLPYLVELGITTVELMPIAAFPGDRGWGYDGVALFAPHAAYGCPMELKQLIDDAHGLGLSILLDVVYNHFGPAGNYLPSFSPEYFSRRSTGWGEAPDFLHAPMRAYVLENARYWLEEFRFDGLRLDATHAIYDDSPRHLLQEIVGIARALVPERLIVAEDDRNDPSLVERLGLDAIWADDFHHQVRVTCTGESDGYYRAYRPGPAQIAEVIQHGWLYRGQISPVSGQTRGRPADALDAHSFVYCVQNHDQIGNRALGGRLNHDLPIDLYCALSALLLFLPMTPLLFMGQEWAASSPFLYFTDHDAELGLQVSAGRRAEFKDFSSFASAESIATIPDPQALETFDKSRLNWGEQKDEPHARVLSLYRTLLKLRRTDAVLSRPMRHGLSARAIGDTILVVERRIASDRRLIVLNLDAEAALPPEETAAMSIVLETGPAAPVGLLAPHSAVLYRKGPLAASEDRKASP